MGECIPISMTFSRQGSRIKTTQGVQDKTKISNLSSHEKKKLAQHLGAIDWQALDHFYGQKGETDRQKIKLTYFKKNIVISGKEHTPPALLLLINYLEELSQ